MIEKRTKKLYGEPLGPASGVQHVMAVAREGEQHRVIEIGPRAPKSETDRFVLDLARARADVVLITAAILRAEPELRYALPDAFVSWREAHGLSRPLKVAVLSRGRVPYEHPIFRASTAELIVLTQKDALPADLRGGVTRFGFDADALTPRTAIRFLTDQGLSVSVEAGPTVAVPLYDDPSVIDELLLSVFDGRLHEDANGDRFLSETELRSRLKCLADTRIEEPSGAWRFTRWQPPGRPSTPADYG